MEKKAIRGKQRARKLILQALYQWLMTSQDISAIEEQFRALTKAERADMGYFSRLLYEIPKQIHVIEEAIIPFLDRPIAELNPIELTVLRLGAFELLFCPEIPYKVVLNESITLTKEYGSQDGHRYVNGILNNLARKVRAVEIDMDT